MDNQGLVFKPPSLWYSVQAGLADQYSPHQPHSIPKDRKTYLEQFCECDFVWWSKLQFYQKAASTFFKTETEKDRGREKKQ